MAQRRKRTFGEIQERRNSRTRKSKFYPRYVLPGLADSSEDGPIEGEESGHSSEDGPTEGEGAGNSRVRFSPGIGFETYGAASKWLDSEKELWDAHVAAGTTSEWTPPKERLKASRANKERNATTVKDLCERWLSGGGLKASSVSSTRNKLEYSVYNTSLADVPVVAVDNERVRDWWREVQERWPERGNGNAMGYRRLHTAFQFAVDEMKLISENPVKIKGAGRTPRSENRDKALISRDEARLMVEGSPERLRAPVSLLLWCGLRLGELLELRRRDLVGLAGDGEVTVRVRRTAQRVQNPDTRKSEMVAFDTPKTAAGNRDVVVPAAVAARLRDHAERFMGNGADALVVTTQTGRQMLDTTFRERFRLPKTAAGRSDVTPHDCRRFYGTMLVTNGVDLEAARRLMGHETVAQLMEYQRAASGYGESAAAVLDGLM